ncbi:hypothetical protein SLA_3288 [Streptomyces laurentii]|uniref:Uncharacterized protein n=1 Tax=Streptomyces laurentii TaxID=39478 RepID=A0A160NZ17_STRLU|nr:hypothetical protein SLA_3288 [Streptomyces laurentii]
MAEVDGLDVVHVEVAEGEQAGGQRVRHGLGLGGGERRLAGAGRGPFDEGGGELADVLVGQRALLAAEGDEAREPDPAGGPREPGPGNVVDQQFLHQWPDGGGGEAAADDCWIHLSPPGAPRWSPGLVSVVADRFSGGLSSDPGRIRAFPVVRGATAFSEGTKWNSDDFYG